MKTKALFLGVISAALLLAAVPAFALQAQEDSNFESGKWFPSKSRLVLNIFHKVTNDEDSGMVGYWALDDYVRHVQVWQNKSDPTKFTVVASYLGKWETFAGALSPGAGVAQSKDASGMMYGGYKATFTADSVTPKFGYIGTKDYGGTEADVMLGTYGAGQAGPTTPFSYLNQYFTNWGNFNYEHWGWTYKYRHQAWKNFDTGTTGDIVV